MPTYGFEECAIVSSRNRRKNEKRLPMTITKPVKLSQLRSRDGRRGAEEGCSVFIPVALRDTCHDLDESSRTVETRRDSDKLQTAGGMAGRVVRSPPTARQLWHMQNGMMRTYFLNFRMWATKPLMSSSERPSDGFIRTLPSLSLKPSLMALNATSSFSASWTLASV